MIELVTASTGTEPPAEQLLERGVAFDALAQAFADVVAGRGRMLFVTGEAGVGKTALLRRFADDVGGARVLWGTCDALFTPRPLGPLLDVARVVGGSFAELVLAAAKPHDVHEALVAELASEPTVLVLEDVHWADEATLDVVRLLARRLQAIPALLLVSYRNDELQRTHPLRLVLGELAVVREVGRVELAPLSWDAERASGSSARGTEGGAARLEPAERTARSSATSPPPSAPPCATQAIATTRSGTQTGGGLPALSPTEGLTSPSRRARGPCTSTCRGPSPRC